ncbi:MAG: hypothetical protein ABR499_03795 [Gemmatimonadaceae bacterium]
MRRAVLPSLLLACAGLQPAVVRAQAAPDTACSYSRCALRVEHRFLSTRLVRGASGESVSRLGWFGRGVDVLLAGPGSAAYHARQYRSRRTTSDALDFVAAALAVVAATQTDDFVESGPFLLTATALELISLPFWLGARRSLDRSVWWYNRELPRP